MKQPTLDVGVIDGERRGAEDPRTEQRKPAWHAGNQNNVNNAEFNSAAINKVRIMKAIEMNQALMEAISRSATRLQKPNHSANW